MRFFWPTRLRSDIGPIGRLGRVLHWLGCIAAALIIGGTVAYCVSEDGNYSAGLGLAALYALPWVLLGRGARYVLAGE